MSKSSFDLEASLIAVCDAEGRIVGTGFVVNDSILFTCAHVIEVAGSGPNQLVNIRFHVNGANQVAQVLPEYWQLPDDVAVLCLKDKLPVDVKSVILGKAAGSEKHPFRTLGYPGVGDYEGIFASGMIEGVVPKSDKQHMLQLTSSQLAQGHSGAPVWDEARQQVVGMVSEVYRPGQDSKNRDTAFATRAEILLQICLELTESRGWPTRAVEFSTLLGMTQSINHLQPERGRTVDLRRGDALDRLDGPFDELAHTIDVRRIDSNHTRGRYNVANLGLVVWRLKLYSVTLTPAYCLGKVRPHCYMFNVLGIDTLLYKQPQDETELTHATGELDLVLSRRTLEMDLRNSKESGSKYYGEGKSLAIWVDDRPMKPDPQLVPADKIISADLSNWQYRTPRNRIAVDPALGRIAFPPSQLPRGAVRVGYYYGFSANIGGGEYDRPLSQPADAKLYLVGKHGVFKRINDALRQWQQDRPTEAIIEITDSNVYVEIIDIRLGQDQSLQIRAANRTRPILQQLDWSPDMPAGLLVSMTHGSRFTLDGLLITGFGVKVRKDYYEGALPTSPTAVGEDMATAGVPTNMETDNSTDLAELNIRHCTLVPGWALHRDWEPEFPFEPSLGLFDLQAQVNIEHCIVGPIRVYEDTVTSQPAPIYIADSILDATSSKHEALGAAPGDSIAHIVLKIQRCTVFGLMSVHAIELAENCIFNDCLNVAQQELGRMQSCYVPDGCRTPRRVDCQPDLAEKTAEAELLKLNRNATRAKIEVARDRARERVQPQFTHRRYGQPGYAQLAETCADEIKCGADDASEMGVFHDLYQSQRVANLRTRLDEYTKAGMDAGIIYAS